MLPVLLIIYLLVCVVWDIKFSRASSILKTLKESEPNILDSLDSKLLMTPTSLVGRVVGSGAYLKVESMTLRKEIMDWQEAQFRRSFYPMAFFVLYIMVCLFVRAIISA